MGKAHAVAYAAVGAVFETRLRPVLQTLCTTTLNGAQIKAKKFGFQHATGDWTELVADHQVDAIVIASPPQTHRDIALAALAASKPVFCEKPLGDSLDSARAMTAAADESGVVNMVGFNYIRTPASQLAREIIAAGEIGTITHFRGEHTENFLANPTLPANWRTRGMANGAMGDLAPHMINGALALVGPIAELTADIHTIYTKRQGKHGPETVTNDDLGQLLCRFTNGAIGMLHFSRVAVGRKMGYAYEITGTRGAIRFDQEDQNSLWLCTTNAPPGRDGFTRILTSPEHPDYAAFCQGGGHGTGYQDQIIIEAKDFLAAIASGKSQWPTFRDGLAVSEVVAAAWQSHQERRWVELKEIQQR